MVGFFLPRKNPIVAMYHHHVDRRSSFKIRYIKKNCEKN
jgi:hypothetical protein